MNLGQEEFFLPQIAIIICLFKGLDKITYFIDSMGVR